MEIPRWEKLEEMHLSIWIAIVSVATFGVTAFTTLLPWWGFCGVDHAGGFLGIGFVAFFLAIPLLGLMFLVDLVKALSKKESWHNAGVTIVAGLAVVASFILHLGVIDLGRNAAISRFEDRMKPVVEAVESYAADHGGPPPTLQALVPRYLNPMPADGLCAERPLELKTPEKQERESASSPGGWTLQLPVVLSFDTHILRYEGANGPDEPARWTHVHWSD